MFASVVDFASALMAGGTQQIVLLIVLVVVALPALLLGWRLAWKLLVQVGKR